MVETGVRFSLPAQKIMSPERQLRAIYLSRAGRIERRRRYTRRGGTTSACRRVRVGALSILEHAVRTKWLATVTDSPYPHTNFRFRIMFYVYILGSKKDKELYILAQQTT